LQFKRKITQSQYWYLIEMDNGRDVKPNDMKALSKGSGNKNYFTASSNNFLSTDRYSAHSLSESEISILNWSLLSMDL